MPRGSLEVADVFRAHGPAWRRARAGHLSLGQLKVMSAIEHCRTAALGGHVAACEKCGHTHIAYNSCRNRHCPKCQGAAAKDWLAARQAELLATSSSPCRADRRLNSCRWSITTSSSPPARRRSPTSAYPQQGGDCLALTVSLPRVRLLDGDGGEKEWRSQTIQAYKRLTKRAEAIIANTYLAGTNTRRVRRALAGLFGGTLITMAPGRTRLILEHLGARIGLIGVLPGGPSRPWPDLGLGADPSPAPALHRCRVAAKACYARRGLPMEAAAIWPAGRASSCPCACCRGCSDACPPSKHWTPARGGPRCRPPAAVIEDDFLAAITAHAPCRCAAVPFHRRRTR